MPHVAAPIARPFSGSTSAKAWTARVADVLPGQPGELGRLVEERRRRRQEGDLLEGDDVRVECRAMIPRDPLQPVAIDVPPPGGRERLARADRRPDVPGRDPDGRRAADHRSAAYLTEPASSPWTK